MVRKCGSIVCAACIIMAMGGKVKAEEQMGTMQVIPEWCGQAIVEGTVSISRVGMKTEEGIVLTDGLANWSMDEMELRAGEWIGWLSQHTEGKKQTAVICSESGAEFKNLEKGIYLVEQLQSAEHFVPFRSFLQTIPENGQWDMILRPKLVYAGESPKTGDHPAPIIGAMGIGLGTAFLMVLVDSRKK